MSDESSLANLEDDGAPPASSPIVTPATVATPAVEPVVPEPEPVEVSGIKHVPLKALTEERDKRRAAETKAARVDQLEQWVASAKPYVEFLHNNPGLLQARPTSTPDAPVPDATPAADPDALEAAKLMDFYTTEGKPDSARGAQWLALQDRRAQRQAAAAVKPWAEASAQERSVTNFHKALQIKDADGRSPSDASLRAVWANMPAEYTADPRVAGVLAMTALGMDRLHHRDAPVPPAQPPLETEASGGHPRARPGLSALEQKVAADRGLDAAKWQERTKGHQPNRTSILEED